MSDLCLIIFEQKEAKIIYKCWYACEFEWSVS